ncbi:transient receptor potential cation channel protein painless-like [Bradysia coprophila]|uniref:transient receptor potential cation channel protein painless-like n=1 Tax=Bradysia coprophila TaxID=38358 RepID=UPI00187DB803|nr:transient receptor potential cation channel protein painless-like [Bradysia coprophila]
MVFETVKFENILTESVESRNVHQFRYILDELKFNPNKKLKCFDGLSTFEAVLLIPKSRKFITTCICNGSDFYKKNDDGIYPLRYAIHSCSAENLIAILKPNEESFTPLCDDHFVATQYSAIINEKSDGGNNYLHLLANNITADNYAELSKMIMAMLVNGCNVNLPNEQLETPFYLLLKNPVVENGLLNFIIDNVRIDYFTHNSKDIHVLMEERGLAARMGKKMDFTVDTNYMVQHLDDWNETQLVDNLERWKRDTKDLDDEIMELLEAAIVKNLPETVAILMDLVPDINRISKNGKFKIMPGFLACTFGHHQVLKVLLSNTNLSFQSTSLQRNLLHQIFSSEAIDPVDRQKTFDLIITDRRCTLDVINQLDSENRVPLLFACLYECDDIVKELLRRGAYIGYESVFNYIKKDTLEELLDECVKCSGDINGRDCDIYIDYKFLMPPQRNEPEITPAHLICANSNLKEFILHPVIASFVLLKWRKIDFIVYFNLLVYFSFLVFLGYIIVNFYDVSSNFKHDEEYCQITTDYHDELFPVKLNEYVFESRLTDMNISANAITHLLFENRHLIRRLYNNNVGDQIGEKFSEWNDVQIDEEWKTRFRQHFAEHALSYWFGIFGLTLMAAYEVVQCAMSYKKYFLKPNNWLDIMLIVFSFFVLVKNVDVGRDNFKQISAIMILLMGAQSIQLFSKVSAFSLSLHMAILNKVCRTFLRTIAPYMIIISAFGMSFFALNHDDFDEPLRNGTDSEEDPDEEQGFQDPFLSTISTVKMMLSDFGDLTIEEEDHFQGILFLAFMISISIVMFQLLNALAITDIQEMIQIAEFVQTRRRISTLRSYETLYSFFSVTYANVFPRLTTILLTPNKYGSTKYGAIKIKYTLPTTKNATVLMQKTGSISNFEYLYVDWMLWKNSPEPLAFDNEFMAKVMQFVKNQQEKHLHNVERNLNSLELYAIKVAQEDMYKDLSMRISSLEHFLKTKLGDSIAAISSES